MTADPPPQPPQPGSGGVSPWARPVGEPDPGEPPAQPADAAGSAVPGVPPWQLSAYGQSSAPPQPGWAPRPDVVAGGPPERGTTASPNRTLLWVGLGGGALVAIGVVFVLVLALTGVIGGGRRSEGEPRGGPFAGSDAPPRPPLVEACPPPTAEPTVGEPEPPPPGPRLADPEAGISYSQLGAPWLPWDHGVWDQGTLGVEFRSGYYIVTETYSRGTYLASVLSGKVTATVGDSLTLDLECAGRQVAEDVRNSYYPRPNQKENVRDERTTLGGRPAWVSVFHLTFQEEGLEARGETVAVVLVDVGRPDAAVLYLSIPDTHSQLNPEIDKLIASVRPL